MRSFESAQRIVIFRPGQFGDTLVAFPVIEGLRQLFPRVPIIYCTNRFRKRGFVLGEEVMRINPIVNSIATYYVEDPVRKKWQNLKQQLNPDKDDLLIYLPYPDVTPMQVIRDWFFFFSLGFRKPSAFRASLLWARQRQQLFPLPKESDRLAQSLQASGLPVKPPEACRVYRDDDWAAQRWREWGLANRPVMAVCPGTKMQSKRWPIDRYLKVGIEWHRRTGAGLVIVGGPEDMGLACTLVKGWAGYGFSACGASIPQTAAVLGRAVAYCGNDTGSMHLAAIMGLPCVAIFSSREPQRLWFPYGEKHVVLRHPVPCEKCRMETCCHDTPVCLGKTSVTDVLKALELVWNRPGYRVNKDLTGTSFPLDSRAVRHL